jgi:hypothetical protein
MQEAGGFKIDRGERVVSKAFERHRVIDEQAERRRQQLAEADAYWRPSWRTLELDHDPEADFDY